MTERDPIKYERACRSRLVRDYDYVWATEPNDPPGTEAKQVRLRFILVDAVIERDDALARLVDAEADGAALREALEEISTKVDDRGFLAWPGAAGVADRVLEDDHSGADLLAHVKALEAKLAGAMAVVDAARELNNKMMMSSGPPGMLLQFGDDAALSAALASMTQEKPKREEESCEGYVRSNPDDAPAAGVVESSDGE